MYRFKENNNREVCSDRKLSDLPRIKTEEAFTEEAFTVEEYKHTHTHTHVMTKFCKS